MLPISARWIQEFEKHLYRRQHIILYSNIHDQFLWQGTYQDMAGFLNAYFLNSGFDLIVRYDPVDGLTFPQSEMRQLFDELVRQRQTEQQQERLGQLTNRILERPYSILLFDEIEKAHPDLSNILLQVMDAGKLTDNNGKIADFTNAIIIMTSNAGAFEASKGGLGIKPESGAAQSIEAIKKSFKPEFLNRLDAIVEFNNLDEARLIQVVEKFVQELRDQLKKKKITFEVKPEVLRWLYLKGHQPQYGARPLARTVDEHLKKPLVDQILFGDVAKGGHVKVSLENDALRFEFSKNAQTH